MVIVFLLLTGRSLSQVFAKFEGIRDAVSLHMVEVSPKLSEMQQEKLSGIPVSPHNPDAKEGQPSVTSENQSSMTDAEAMASSDSHYRNCQSKHGVPVSWYRGLQDVPRGFSFFVAHEFFDALPVHKFQVGELGYFSVQHVMYLSLACVYFFLFRCIVVAKTNILSSIDSRVCFVLKLEFHLDVFM